MKVTLKKLKERLTVKLELIEIVPSTKLVNQIIQELVTPKKPVGV